MKAYFKKNNQKVYNLSCLAGLENLIKNKTEIELTVTSPPYFNVKDYVHFENYETYLYVLEQVFTKILTITKSGRFCIVNISNILLKRENRHRESERIPLAVHFVTLMQRLGWKFIEDIIWQKPEGAVSNRNGNFFQSRKPLVYKPNIVTEYIYVFRKESEENVTKIIQNYSDLDILNSKVTEEYERTNIWRIQTNSSAKHPCAYPIQLTDKLVKYYSFVGDTVLDPFFGSGTTSLSCSKLNRKCIGFEIHSKFIDIYIDRMKRIKPNELKTKLFDKRDFEDLTKDESVKILNQNPKRMLAAILNSKMKVKNMTKKKIIEKIVELLI